MTKATFDDLVPHAPKGRFDGVRRTHTAEEVLRLRGSLEQQTEHSQPTTGIPVLVPEPSIVMSRNAGIIS